MLRYKKEDWTQEAMNNQESYFDKEDVPHEQKIWSKLAQNLLYNCDSKNIVKQYNENRHKVEAKLSADAKKTPSR